MRYAVALLLGSIASAVGAAQQGAATIRRVRGVVVNAVSRAPVARALVTTADQRMAQMTDSEGRFEFEVRLTSPQSGGVPGMVMGSVGNFDPNGTVFLMARKPGYRSMDRPASLSLSDKEALDGVVRVSLVPEGIVAGHVSTMKAEPPVGVSVQLMHKQVEEGRGAWRAMQIQMTNSQGEYRFADLPAGDYKVVSREWTERNAAQGEPTVGYPPAAYPSGADESAAGLVHVAAGESVQADLALRAVPYYPVDIPVANVGTAQGVGVSVLDAAGGAGFSLGFDQRTQRVAGSLPAGSYRLLLTSYGERPLMASVNLTVEGPVRGGAITLLPGGTVRVAVREEFTVAAQTSGRDQLRFGTSQLRPGERSVEVFLQPIGGDGNGGSGLKAPTRGKEAGNDGLVIENVRPGSYWARVTPHRGYVASATMNGEDVLRQPMTVAAGSGAGTLEIALRDDVATLSGTVSPVPASGAGAYNVFASVWCYPLEGAGQPMQTFIDPQGHFLNASMPPGKYVVVASDKPMQEVEYRDEEAMKRLAAQGTVVTLASGGTATVALKLTRAGE